MGPNAAYQFWSLLGTVISLIMLAIAFVNLHPHDAREWGAISGTWAKP